MYDPERSTQRVSKRKYDDLEREKNDLQDSKNLLELIVQRDEKDALAIFRQIRSGISPSAILSLLRMGDPTMESQLTSKKPALPPLWSLGINISILHSSVYPSLEPLPLRTDSLDAVGLSSSMSDLNLGASPRTDSMSGSSPLVDEHDLYDCRLCDVDASYWTRVKVSNRAVANLISVYLSWCHPTTRLFDQNLFLEDLVAYRHDFCSSVLVNALLAHACVGLTPTAISEMLN